jgi:hypothetical protein
MEERPLRYCQRAGSADRHPGHVETHNLDEHRELLLRGRIEPLPLGGTLYELDTTDFAIMDYPALMSALSAAASR